MRIWILRKSSPRISTNLNWTILLLLLAGMTSQVIGQSGGIRYEQEVSQTAVFPGDRFQYTVTVYAPEDVTIALEDFGEKSVNFEPFFLTDQELIRDEMPDGRIRYRVNYLLTNLEIGDQEVEIPRLIFRYEGEASPASGPSTQEIAIPPFPMLVRTTLNAPLQESWLRESLEASAEFSYPWWLLGIALVGLLIGSYPLAGWAWRQVPRWHARRQRMSRRDFLHQWNQSLSEVKSEQASGVKERFEKLDRAIRDYLSYSRGSEVQGLTARELNQTVLTGEFSDGQAETLRSVLEHAERCRYGPSDQESWEPIFQEDLQKLEQLRLETRPRAEVKA